MIEKILAGILGLFPNLPFLRKKPHCIWVWDGQKWNNENKDGNSHRRCEQAVAALIKIGVKPENIVILPKNVTPPPIHG
jgi:hypothetical protein